MANKKISQLVGIGTSSTVSGTFLLPVASGPNGGQYNTVRTTTTGRVLAMKVVVTGGGGSCNFGRKGPRITFRKVYGKADFTY